MEFKIKTGDLAKHKTPCLVLGVFEKRKLAEPAQAVDQASGGRLTEILKRGDLDGETGRTLMLYDVPGIAAERVLLVGCGKQKEFTRANYRQALAA
jgi:leucyl aminopeptidase